MAMSKVWHFYSQDIDEMVDLEHWLTNNLTYSPNRDYDITFNRFFEFVRMKIYNDHLATIINIKYKNDNYLMRHVT